jgi:hypothetical protein
LFLHTDMNYKTLVMDLVKEGLLSF